MYYLAKTGNHIYLPVDHSGPKIYFGKTPGYRWPDNVHEIELSRIQDERFDCILYQHHDNWTFDQFKMLSESQRRLPRLFLEHDPPRQHPTDTEHPVDDPAVVIVHVTYFNQLMWDCRQSPTTVIEHGVEVAEDAIYDGSRPYGVAVINNLRDRGRRLGSDVFDQAKYSLGELDLIGMGSEEFGGLGEVRHAELPYRLAAYRYFFNPIRYTSLGLSVLEAMAVGLPIVGMATTELATVIVNGESGYINTRLDQLIEHMKRLNDKPDEAMRLGTSARIIAKERFGLAKFTNKWNEVLRMVINSHVQNKDESGEPLLTMTSAKKK